MTVLRPIAVFVVDLNLKVDEWQTAALWQDLVSGSRDAVVPGAPVIATDEEEAFSATVTEVLAAGPRLVVDWDRKVPVPETLATASA